MEEIISQSETVIQSVDISALETLLAQNNNLLLHVYAYQLFLVGVVGAVAVVFLLYKFIKQFY